MVTSQYTDLSSEYVEALRSTQTAKNLFWWAIAVAIVVQLGAYVLIRFVGAIDAAPQLASQITAETQYDQVTVDRAEVWYDLLYWLLPGMKFLAVVSCTLLVLTLLLAVKLSLVGRLGGIAGFISAFFWSLILFVIVIPWQQVLHGAFVSGSLYSLEDLVRWTETVRAAWGAEDVSLVDHIFHYARFIAFPLMTLLVWFLVHIKFARGVTTVMFPPVVTTAPAAPSAPQQ